MDLNELLQIGGGAVILIAAVGVLIGNIYYVLRSKANKIQKEEIEQLKKDFGHCEAQHRDSLKMIHTLEGQIKTLSSIPLLEIRDGIKSIAVTNGKILDRLDETALIRENEK